MFSFASLGSLFATKVLSIGSTFSAGMASLSAKFGSFGSLFSSKPMTPATSMTNVVIDPDGPGVPVQQQMTVKDILLNSADNFGSEAVSPIVHGAINSAIMNNDAERQKNGMGIGYGNTIEQFKLQAFLNGGPQAQDAYVAELKQWGLYDQD